VFVEILMIYSFFSRLALLLTLPMAGFALVAVLLGGTQSIHPALRGFGEGCADTSQPCWYGIVPGQTTLDEALTMLEHYGLTAQQDPPFDSGVRYYIFADTCVFNITARTETTSVLAIAGYGCSDLHLGDFITVFGAPIITVVEIDCGGRFYSMGFTTIHIDDLNFYSPTTSVQSRINRFYINNVVASSDWTWRDFSPYGHLGRSAHRPRPRCSG
jgi:hypothetical protein